MKGRKPVPTHLKLLRGNPGKRPLPENQPTPEPGAAMPDYLSPGAAAHWPTVASELDAAGVLTRLDQTALALYCETFVRWRHATDHVAQHGPVIVSPSGLERLSPYLVIADRASEQMLRLLTEFGMTPSSRSRVSRVKPDRPQMNPRAALLTRAGYQSYLDAQQGAIAVARGAGATTGPSQNSLSPDKIECS